MPVTVLDESRLAMLDYRGEQTAHRHTIMGTRQSIDARVCRAVVRRAGWICIDARVCRAVVRRAGWLCIDARVCRIVVRSADWLCIDARVQWCVGQAGYV